MEKFIINTRFLFAVTFCIVSLFPCPTGGVYLAPPGASYHMRSFEKQSNKIGDIIKMRIAGDRNSYKYRKDVRTTGLFKYLAGHVRNNPKNIDTIIHILNEEKDTYRDAILNEAINRMVYYLRVVAFLENIIIAYENTKQQNIVDQLPYKLTQQRFWMNRGYDEYGTLDASFFMHNVYRQLQDVMKKLTINLDNAEQLDFMCRIVCGDKSYVEDLAKYNTDVRKFLKQYLYKVLTSGQSFKKKFTKTNLEIPKFWDDKLKDVFMGEDVTAENIIELIRTLIHKSYFKDSSDLNVIRALHARVAGLEWRTILNVRIEEKEKDDDLNSLLKLHLMEKIRIPSSKNVRDWRSDIYWDSLSGERKIDNDLITNDQRLGKVIKVFWEEYVKTRYTYRSPNHYQLIIKLAEQRGVIPRSPGEVFNDYIAILKEDNDVRERLKIQIRIVSFIAYELKRMRPMYAEKDDDEEVSFDRAPVSKDNVPRFRLTYEETQGRLLRIIEQVKEDYSDSKEIFKKVFRRFILELNDYYSFNEIHPFIELSSIPEYPDLIEMSEQEWNTVIMNYVRSNIASRETLPRAFHASARSL